MLLWKYDKSLTSVIHSTVTLLWKCNNRSKLIFFILSDVIVESNVREVKVHSPDYKGVEADEVDKIVWSIF